MCLSTFYDDKDLKTLWPESTSDRRLSAKLVPTFANRGVFFEKFCTTCLGIYGRNQVLKLLWRGNRCAHLALLLVRPHVCADVFLVLAVQLRNLIFGNVE
jgi:hypothetical protein